MINKILKLSSLGNLLIKYGYSGLDSSSSKNLGESLDKLKKSGDDFFNRLVRIMLTRTMNQAKYFSSSEFDYSDFCHYGLAMEIYTHYTSPIRRYSDVLVHRLLSAAIEYEALPFDMTNKSKLNKQCDQMNRQNRVAFFCSRESNDFSTFLFFENKSETIDVVIFGVDNFSVKAISQKYGMEANVQFQEKNCIKETDIENKEVKLKDGTDLKVFDKVQVEVKASYFNFRRTISYHFLKKLN